MVFWKRSFWNYGASLGLEIIWKFNGSLNTLSKTTPSYPGKLYLPNIKKPGRKFPFQRQQGPSNSPQVTKTQNWQVQNQEI